MHLRIFLSFLLLFAFQSGFSQTYIKPPALIEGFSEIATSAGTTTLTKDSQTNQFFTGTSTQTVVLPSALTIPLGRAFLIQNKSTGALTVNSNGGALLTTVEPDTQIRVTVTNVGSAAGIWNVSTSGGGLTGILGVDQGGTGLDATGAANGSLLIGNGTDFDLTTLTGTTNQVNVTNGAGSITLSTPQDIHSGATPQFDDVQVLGTGLGNRLVGKTLAQLSSTGVIKGLTISINADPAKFDIAAGTYEIVDNYTDPDAPVVTPVTYAGSTANVTTNLATADATYILLDSAGAITQQTTYPTPSERRAKALVGRVTHQNRTSITFANTFPDIKNGIVSQFYDLCDAMAPFKIGGLSLSANGANLSFNRSSGSVFFRANTWVSTPANPHTSTYSAATAQAFRKATQTTIVDVSDVTVIDPTNYDNAGTVTAVPSSTNATIQRVYLYKSGGVRVFYGQTWYPNFAQAVANLNQDPFVVNPTVEQSAVLIGYIIATKGATDLSNTTNTKIISAARFDAGGAASSGGITTLQQAYLNSVLPQIVLNSTHGALTIDDAATPIGTLVDIRNNAGTTSYAKIDATGLSATGFTGTGTTGAVRVHNLTTTQRNALTGAEGMVVANTTTGQMNAYLGGVWGEVDREYIASDTSISNGGQIIPSLTHSRQTWRISGASTPVTMNTIPFGSTAPIDGAEINLVGVDDSLAVTFVTNDAAKGLMGYGFTLGRFQMATIKYIQAFDRWVVKSVSN